jgi:hypothetical protein
MTDQRRFAVGRHHRTRVARARAAWTGLSRRLWPGTSHEALARYISRPLEPLPAEVHDATRSCIVKLSAPADVCRARCTRRKPPIRPPRPRRELCLLCLRHAGSSGQEAVGVGRLPAGGARRHDGPRAGTLVASLCGLRPQHGRMARWSRISAAPSRATGGAGLGPGAERRNPRWRPSFLSCVRLTDADCGWQLLRVRDY